MKQKLFLLFTASILVAGSYAQKTKKNGFVPGQKKPALFGVAFTLSDFNAPNNFKSSNGVTIPIKDMSAGVSVSYWKGITPFIDFSAKLNGVFHDYSSLYQGLPGKTEVGIELEPTINVRPLKDENVWAPFLTAGIGAGIYTGKMGAYIPLGGGIQFNASSTTYLFIQAQYKWALTTKVTRDNLFYSIGFAQNIKGD